MASSRTAWHPPFVALLEERCPSSFEVRAELVLTAEPQRADVLLVRRRNSDLGEARVLRRLWPLLSEYTLLEYKSGARPPRRGDLLRLAGYGPQFHAPRAARIGPASNLTLVIVAPRVTGGVRLDLSAMGWGLEDLGGGYRRVVGANYPTLIVLLDEVSEADADPLLGAFGNGRLPEEDLEAARWFFAHVVALKETDMSDLDGFEELARKMPPRMRARFLAALAPEDRLAGLALEDRLAGLALEDRLAGLALEDRLAGLAPQDRLAGMAPQDRLADLTADQAILALPDATLARLPAEFIDQLPDEVRSAGRSASRRTAERPRPNRALNTAR